MMKVKFVTFGCSRNQADTELMKSICKHEIVEQGQEVTVVNTCFVKGETEKKILKLLSTLKGKAVVTGCLAQAHPELIEAFPQHSFLGVQALERINEAIEKQIIDVSSGKPDFCNKKPESLISIVPISDGCLGSCTYCCTRLARGKLKSRPIDKILKQVIQDLLRGVKEFWLTGQDTGCYGFDINSSLPELIKEITRIPDDFKVRVGMMNPQHALRILPQLKNCFNDKVYKFLHVPVQSGSDKVLREMNREYTVKSFKKVVNSFKDFTISTDIICGYPTETEVDWQATINLINELKPRVLNISRFHPRLGTKASMLKQHNSRVIKERSRELSKLYKRISLNKNKSFIERYCKVLITQPGVGRDEYYRLIKVKAPTGFNKVKIIGAGLHHLKGKQI